MVRPLQAPAANTRMSNDARTRALFVLSEVLQADVDRAKRRALLLLAQAADQWDEAEATDTQVMEAKTRGRMNHWRT